tara:strand:- start:2801 stop:3901 length:1101 start_codon:yes stop_codon:yes gene_type:complete
MIPVTKPYLPSREKLDKLIDGIYERQWLTNNGKLVQELTERLEDYLEVKNLLLVANGTLALQIAYRTLGITESSRQGANSVITTPFTFVATASSLKWDGAQPIFSDINKESWCLAPEHIEPLVTDSVKAIVPVHVFGNVCEVESIQKIADRHALKVVYDASHAFRVKYKGKSILSWGDAATLSFHATKLFHTAEGGAIVFKRKEDFERAKKLINFGITGPEVIEELGINAKMNELQAAIGLCVLDEIEYNMEARQKIWHYYERELKSFVQLQEINEEVDYNYAYFPILLDSEEMLLRTYKKLRENSIFARRYFFPSLESVSYLSSQKEQIVSNNIASRILCLPIYSDLKEEEQQNVIDIIKRELKI